MIAGRWAGGQGWCRVRQRDGTTLRSGGLGQVSSRSGTLVGCRGFSGAAGVCPQGRAERALVVLDGGDTSFQDAISIGEDAATPEVLPIALCERSLAAMARGKWDRAQALAGEARAALRRAGSEESFATPLVCAVQARTALHRGDTATGTSAACRCSADAAVADLCAPLSRRAGPDRAHPCLYRARRPGRRQDAHTGDR